MCGMCGVRYSEMSDDVVLHVIKLLLRLSSVSSAVKTAADQCLLVSRVSLAFVCFSFVC